VRATDGYYHLAYELLLTGLSAPIDVQRLEVRDASNHRVLLSLTGAALAADMNPIGSAHGPASAPTTIGDSQEWIVWLDVRIRKQQQLPRALEHRVVGLITPPGAGAARGSYVVARVGVRRQAPVVLSPPVGPGIWVSDEGCCSDPTHHRRGLFVVDGKVSVSQRFAIDWMRLDQRHRAWVGDPPPLGPLPKPPLAQAEGNHVTIQIGPGQYVLYGHLERRSIRARVGQHVHRGQLLGRIGNSGNSSTPHTHIQVQSSPDTVSSDGLPFVFDRFYSPVRSRTSSTTRT